MSRAYHSPQIAQDDLCCLAQGYLKHAELDRALVLLLTAMQIAEPSPRLLLLLSKCFLMKKSPQQAAITLKRYQDTFGASDLSDFMLRQCSAEDAHQLNADKP